jgi:putative ABC transport system permease protein
MEPLWQDLRYAVRLIIQKPAFAVLIIVTLALGIGANTAIFSIVNSILLRSLPYPESDRLMMLMSTNENGAIALSPLDFNDLTKQSKGIDAAAAIQKQNHNVTGKTEPERIAGAAVSWNFFHVMGIKPQIGRGFTQNEATRGSDKVAVISHGLWRDLKSCR